jgi:hypothetical protein
MDRYLRYYKIKVKIKIRETGILKSHDKTNH